MVNTLQPQSQLADPYSLYEECLLHHPVYWDDANKIWAVYSYEHCLKILSDKNAQIPPVKHFSIDATIDTISVNLVRLSNPPNHQALKAVAFFLFDKLKNVQIPEILFSGIEKIKDQHTVDWAVASRKLFPTLIVKGFDFPEEDGTFLVENVLSLVKLMGGLNDEKSFEFASTIINEAYEIINRYFAEKLLTRQEVRHLASVSLVDEKDILTMLTSNFIGLLIQSYDAGRGLLANGLVQLLRYKNEGGEMTADENFYRKIIIETLRFDPPVHNTRRVAMADILIGETTIKKGETILLVLAAANRDAAKFLQPNVFDINRSNNEHLTFGAGGHACLAKHYCIDMAAKNLDLLLAKYPSLKLLQPTLRYEPLINVRIPESLFIKLQ
ncbi:cytochrome P450 [Pinibacter aurantiacus]|uniref:Cytochrome P450 n=1 Tax=Pinibacter aurantiacus TaxID=2851599 RepID=A0A9E2S9E3_9BACT|nr:cytochrome P450 [Pinibacter aurantiacus]MBV4355765.1 cytochrome P450 [Pinibacter aurantiacus]